MFSEKQILNLFKISKATLRRLEKDGLPYKIRRKNKKFYFPADVALLIDRNRAGSRTLVVGNSYTNKEIYENLKVASQGGMRRSHSANALVLLIRKKGNPCYHDVWTGGNELIYVGMGLTGNQKLKGTQNATLKNSNDLSIVIHLFEECITTNKYVYKGIVCLDPKKAPYQDLEPDINGHYRKVWKFPLVLL